MTSVKEGGTYQVYGASWNAQGLPANSGLRAGAYTDSSGYQFDGVGRLVGRTTNFGIGFGPYVTFTFGCNPASQLASRSRSNDLYAFGGYLNVSRGYQKNGLNQYTQAGNLTLGYDPNGNLTTDSVSGYGYDIENRLVTGPGTTLTWDPLGRLYQVAGPSSTTQFLYDGDQLAGEYNTSGTLLRRYAHGTGEDDPLFWYEGATLTSRRALHADHQGSIIAVSDGSTVTPYSYDEYGIPAAGQTARFQYTGQAWIPELGMYHYKARFYSPTLGRFLQTDPIGYDDQVNLYAYVANDPVNGRDPSGERISVVIHEVARGQYHTKIVVVPDDQKTFRNDDRFETSKNGTRFLTIGGGPDTKLNIFGPLVGNTNRPADVSKTLSGESLEVARIAPRKGDTENNLINRMIGVSESYKDDKPYSLFLSAKGNDYNSNSFAYGVSDAVGAKNVPIPNGVSLPGASKPLPPENFCKLGVSGCAQ